MTETTDELGWEVPTPGDESEAGEWATILNAALNDDIEPDVAKALESSPRGSSYSIWQNPTIGSQRSVPMPDFERVQDGPLFTASDLSWIDTGEFNWLSVLRVGHLPVDTLGDYYLWTSPHDPNSDGSQGLGLLYADDPTGPWTEYPDNPVLSQAVTNERVGESTLFWDPDIGRFRCYHASHNSHIAYAESPTGYDQWTNTQKVLQKSTGGPRHCGYRHALRTDAGVYLYGWNKWGENDSNNAVAFSEDGLTDWREVRVHIGHSEVPTGDTSVAWAMPNLIPYLGGYLVTYRRRDGTDSTVNIGAGFTTDGFAIQDRGIALDAATGTFEEGELKGADLFWDGEKLWMFYVGGMEPPDGTGGCGVAVADFSGGGQ